MAVSDKGYTSSGDMNRLTALAMSSELFLESKGEQLTGLGLGNCDYAEGFEFLTTPFYKENSLIHYNWMSTSFVYLEMGIIGLIFYFGFFAVIVVYSGKLTKKHKEDEMYFQLTITVALMSILIGIYNSSLRMEAAYMIYFILSIPFLLERTRRKEEKENVVKKLC